MSKGGTRISEFPGNSLAPIESVINIHWPELPYEAWKDTYETLHRWTQIVGKIELKLKPFVNHWWETAFSVSARGLKTSLIPYGERAFDMEFNFVDHLLSIRTAESQRRAIALTPRSVADF